MRSVPASLRLAACGAFSVLAGAGSPAVAAAPGTPPIVVLGTSAGHTYALCPPKAASRTECWANAASPKATLAALVARAHAPGVRRLVLFLPGFSTAFAESLKLAAGIATVFGPQFAVIDVDWGTHGSKAEYEADARRSRKIAPSLVGLIRDLHGALRDRPLDLFAHSMGSRVVTRAIALIPVSADGGVYVRETVLAAPDVTLVDYSHAIGRNPKPFGSVTIYVSRYDKALGLSSFIHLHRRLGQLALWKHTVADTTVVDASNATKMGIGHGYALHDPDVIADIGDVLEERAVPHPSWKRSGLVWTLVPDKVQRP